MKSKKPEETPQNMLKELCGSDSALYEYLSRNLYETPLTAISSKEIVELAREGVQNGNFAPAVDKAVFESAQNPGETQKYIAVVQDLAAKAIAAAEKEKAEKQSQASEGQLASLDRRIEQYRFLSERVKDVLDVSAEFYAEKLVELEEGVERKERARKKSRAANKEQILAKRALSGRKERKKELRKMGRKERREAKKQDKLDHEVAEQRKIAREQQRQTVEKEERRIEEMEEKGRESRQSERTQS